MNDGQTDPTANQGFDFSPGAISTAIMDPRTQALLGLAGGLAQAAMPSRMKIPTGAAIGLGAQGLTSGLANSMQLQQQGMALRLNQARMPAQLALANAYAGSVAPGATGGPFGVPAAHTPALPAGSPGAGPVAGPASGAAAPFGVPGSGTPGAAPADAPYTTAAREWQLGMISQSVGDSASAVQHFKTAQELSGGEGYEGTANGGSMPTPGGPNDLKVIQGKAAATAWGGVPAHLIEQGKTLTPNGIAPAPGAVGTNYALAESDAAGKAYGAGTNDMTTIQLPDPKNPGQLRDVTVTKNQAAILSANGGAPPAQAADGSGVMSGSDFVQRINRNPANTPNPGSTALGPADVTNRPWQQFMAMQHPELQGVGAQQLTQLKNDPNLASEFTLWNARQNATVLTGANVPVNASTLALAHRLGGQGAADVLNVPPATPLTSIPSIVQSGALRLMPNGKPINPDLIGATAGQVSSKYRLLYPATPVDLGGGASAQPSAPVGIPGAPHLTPEQSAIATGYGQRATQIIQQGGAADSLAAKLPILANAADYFNPGASGPARLRAQQILSDVYNQAGLQKPDWLTNGTTGGEVIQKEGMSIAQAAVKAMGDKAGFVLRLVAQNLPNTSLSKGGFNAVLQGLQQEVQRQQDLRTYQENWVNDPSHNGSIKGMEAQFARDFPPEAYASRVVPFAPPKNPSAAIPNVIYSTPRGPMKWVGNGFTNPSQ